MGLVFLCPLSGARAGFTNLLLYILVIKVLTVLSDNPVCADISLGEGISPCFRKYALVAFIMAALSLLLV